MKGLGFRCAGPNSKVSFSLFLKHTNSCKVILDRKADGPLSPSLSRGRPPLPTADRLHTVVSLPQESGFVNEKSELAKAL